MVKFSTIDNHYRHLASRSWAFRLFTFLSIPYTLFHVFFNSPFTTEHVFNGYIETTEHSGSCYCSNHDNYCLCTPSLAIDVVVVNEERVLTVKRRSPPLGSALPGGFVNIGESVEDAAVRELFEETGVHFDKDSLRLIPKIFTDPKRDVRRHTASVCFAVVYDGSQQLVAGDDAKELEWRSAEELLNNVGAKLQFDHMEIVKAWRAMIT